ncbi:MAG: DUF1501 domain-containing protein, partial [Actinomycetota bacterium]
GGGVRGGQVIGKTDAYGEGPVERPVSPADLGFTLLQVLGLDPRREHQTPDGRPLPILAGGETVAGLL